VKLHLQISFFAPITIGNVSIIYQILKILTHNPFPRAIFNFGILLISFADNKQLLLFLIHDNLPLLCDLVLQKLKLKAHFFRFFLLCFSIQIKWISNFAQSELGKLYYSS